MENWNNLNKLLDINSRSIKRKEQESLLLVELAQKGDKEEIKKVLKNGAAINCFADNTTPLIAAMDSDHYDLVVYLLSVRASISFFGAEGHDDAFWYALKNKKHNFVELFVENRCLLSTDFESSLPAIIYSTIQSDLKSVEELLKHYRMNVNERDSLGNTALHHNVSKESPSLDDIEIGRLLIAAGADVNSRNLDGKTPEEVTVDQVSKAMLLNETLDMQLEEKEDIKPEIDPDVPQIPKTSTGKMKI